MGWISLRQRWRTRLRSPGAQPGGAAHQVGKLPSGRCAVLRTASGGTLFDDQLVLFDDHNLLGLAKVVLFSMINWYPFRLSKTSSSIATPTCAAEPPRGDGGQGEGGSNRPGHRQEAKTCHTEPPRGDGGQGGRGEQPPTPPASGGNLPHRTAQRGWGSGGRGEQPPTPPASGGNLPHRTAQGGWGSGGRGEQPPTPPARGGNLPHRTAQGDGGQGEGGATAHATGKRRKPATPDRPGGWGSGGRGERPPMPPARGENLPHQTAQGDGGQGEGGATARPGGGPSGRQVTPCGETPSGCRLLAPAASGSSGNHPGGS
jgi:hypothetical protein